jgi:hypothetical protein
MTTEAPPGVSTVEIIEIIDDGIDPFAERHHDTPIHDAGGPRWVGPAAAAALVALIGYGIATSSSSNSVPKVADAPSTTISTPTTRPITSTTDPLPIVPYYSADPPREFSVQSAEMGESGQPLFLPGDYQLWATPGANATWGSWFAIESLRTDRQHLYAVDAFRVPTANQTMAISRLPSGQSRIQFSIDNVRSVSITAFGWGDDDLVRLAQSVTVNEPGLVGANVRLSDPTLVDNFQLLSTSHPYLAVFGEPDEQVRFSVGSDPSRGFVLGVVHLDPRGGYAGIVDRQVAVRFFLDRTTPFEVDGHSALAGVVAVQPDQAVATWFAGDHMVSVSGTMSLQEAIEVARTVHQVSPEEWAGMKFQASGNSYGSDGDYTQSEPRAVAFGTDDNGDQWTVNVSTTTFSAEQPGVDWQWSPGGGYGSIASDTAKITTVVDGERTYVLAEMPRAIAPPGHLQVTRTGLEPVLTPFTDTDPNLDRTFAAYAFSEPTSYTAQIIGSDGAVLATWPSP